MATKKVIFIPAMLLLIVSTAASALTIKSGVQWESSTIPVCWENFEKNYRQDRKIIRHAVKHTWEKHSAVKFTGWRKCRPHSAGVRINIQNGYPRTAGRGDEIDGASGGVILPSLWSLAAVSINAKAPVHEFGHVLGFGHEHARIDHPEAERCGVQLSDGEIYQEQDTTITPFDDDSIMVACVAEATASFSVGLPKLSALDIFGLIATYGSNPVNVLDQDEKGDRFGESLLVKDLNGDGVLDLVVGAPGEDDGRGAVYVYKGDKIAGFRPWRKLSWEDKPGVQTVAYQSNQKNLGSAIRYGDNQHESTQPIVSIYSVEKLVLQFKVIGRSNIELVDQPSAVMEYPQATLPAPLLDDLGANLVNFPEWSAGHPALKADLNNDGLDEYIVGATDAGRYGSGAVIILKEDKQGKVSPWYWFGQAY